MQDGRRVGDWIADRYEIFDIHTGGMGVVYVVYDHQGATGQRVLAIKTLRDEFLRDERSNIRFITECGAWIKLDRHPYIVRAYSVQEIQGKPHAVLELVTGGDLRRWIGTPRLDLRQILRFSIQFCLGMEHAVMKGLHCHRDIKPENLLVSEGGTLKITDFGLAKVKAEALAAATGGVDSPIPLAESGADLLAYNPEHSRPIRWDDRPRPSLSPEGPADTLDLPDAGPDPLDPDFDPDDPGVTVAMPGRAGPTPTPTPTPAAATETHVDPSQTVDLPYRPRHDAEGGVGPTVDWSVRPELPPEDLDKILATVDWGSPRPAAHHEEEAEGGDRGDIPLHEPTMTQHLQAETGQARGRGVTRAGALLGTAPYMAPEQFRDAQTVDLRADVYSYGIVLFEMITGHRPFQADTFLKLARQHEKAPVPSIARYIPSRHSRVAKAVDRIVQRCLAKDPSKRYNTYLELRRDLSQCLWYVARERLGQPTEIELEAWELTNKGVSLGTLGRLDEERVSYEESIRVKPDYAPAWFNQAAAVGASGHPVEAIEYADVALHLNPASVPALINKGLALNALGRVDEALTYFDRAVHIQPRDPEVWYGRGYVLLSQGNNEGARSALTQALRLRPTHPEALYGIGVVIARTSPWPEAEAVFERLGDRASLNAIAARRARREPPRLLPIPWVRRTEDSLMADSSH